MKRIIYSSVMLLVIAMLISSCGKTGAVGPEGATGQQGAVGPAGPAGSNGKSGSVIYSGATTPSLSTGTTGDYYLDTKTGLLYGPKTATSWGTGLSLIGDTGAKGATGKAGSQVYSGTGVPATSLGTSGDYFLDKTNYLLYGPKTAGSWGTPVNLQGPAGPRGPEGNANVKTDVFSIGGADWLWNSSYLYETSPGGYTEYFTRYYTRKNTAITQDILNNGIVMVYFTPGPNNNPDMWVPLPYQFDDFGIVYNYVYVTSPGIVTLHYFFTQSDPSVTLPALSSYNDIVRKFKIVAISGTALSLIKTNHISLNDYHAVSKVTGMWLQDKN